MIYALLHRLLPQPMWLWIPKPKIIAGFVTAVLIALGRFIAVKVGVGVEVDLLTIPAYPISIGSAINFVTPFIVAYWVSDPVVVHHDEDPPDDDQTTTLGRNIDELPYATGEAKPRGGDAPNS